LRVTSSDLVEYDDDVLIDAFHAVVTATVNALCPSVIDVTRSANLEDDVVTQRHMIER